MQDGDVVVAGNGRQPMRYTVSRTPGQPELSWSSRTEATRVALEFARNHAVDAWLDDNGAFARLATYRRAR
jgi:hypothetical protein